MKQGLKCVNACTCISMLFGSWTCKAVDVIAVEYPPFTTILQQDGGIAFKLLREKSVHSGTTWSPYFVPPARANWLLEQKKWCASFYPPSDKSNVKTWILSENEVHIGLVRQDTFADFSWRQLDELSGKSVAILRTNEASPFAQTIITAGLKPVYVETIQAAIQLVLLARVDLAMSDNVTFDTLELINKEKLQFSTTALLRPVDLCCSSFEPKGQGLCFISTALSLLYVE